MFYYIISCFVLKIENLREKNKSEFHIKLDFLGGEVCSNYNVSFRSVNVLFNALQEASGI